MTFPALPTSIPGAGFVNSLEHKFARLGTVEKVAVAALVVLGVEHLIAPKGMSMATKMLHKVSPARFPALPPVIPPPGVAAPALPAAVARGAFAGANNMPGWNRGMSAYGGMDGFYWHGHGGPWSQWGAPGGGPDYSWE